MTWEEERRSKWEDNDGDNMEDDKQAYNLYRTCDNETMNTRFLADIILSGNSHYSSLRPFGGVTAGRAALITILICRESGFTLFVPCNAANIRLFFYLIHSTRNIHLPTGRPASHLTRHPTRRITARRCDNYPLSSPVTCF